MSHPEQSCPYRCGLVPDVVEHVIAEHLDHIREIERKANQLRTATARAKRDRANAESPFLRHNRNLRNDDGSFK